MTSKIKSIEGLSQIVRNYDALIIDLWGVIHDGVSLLPGAAECLECLKEFGTPYAFLSNAPRRSYPVINAMQNMGLSMDLVPIVLTSGEATWQALKEREGPWFDGVGRNFYHIGPVRDKNLFDGLSIKLTDHPSQASLIINTGPWDTNESVEDYMDILNIGVDLGIKMVCANPDLEVIRDGARLICAGALAIRYEKIGGEVIYFGKPKRPIYESCLRLLNNPDPSSVLAIGDSLLTDIAGAATMGMDSLLVLDGIHKDQLANDTGANVETVLRQECKKFGFLPSIVIPTFHW
ncbi:MAG: TIGR01459 family HAD-type hydrolase [Rhodospirillaceae bacterium]|nr:TIGR01459 family HAD-type hydrolase [Rhodospirillaceae bacterium]